jgi:hypothetical protein
MGAGLEADRVETLKWAESKLKNPKRSTLKPEPWKKVADNQHKVKFSWNEDTRPPVVDTEGTFALKQTCPLRLPLPFPVPRASRVFGGLHQAEPRVAWTPRDQ